MNSPSTHRRGFTLLYAVLVASLLLAIGLSIFNITIKELVLSGSARESEFAFFAADTGADCALYWDYVYDGFSTSSPRPSIDCAGHSLVPVESDSSGDVYTRHFTLDPLGSSPYCADVMVTKTEETGSLGTLIIRTSVLSRGYNTCDETNPRRVERAVGVNY